MELKVSEIFENQILNELYETRGDGLECLYIRMYGEPKEIKEVKKSKKELEDLIRKYVQDEEKQKELWLKLDRYEGYMSGEMGFWDRQYYKLGFLDKIFLKKEITDNCNNITNNDTEDLRDSFIYKNMHIIKEMLGAIIWNRKDYKEIAHKMSKIKEEYPNVKELLEKSKIVELTKKEVRALKEYLKLADDMQDIELVETFKLGLKDNSLL